jgi:hypothetical protein
VLLANDRDGRALRVVPFAEPEVERVRVDLPEAAGSTIDILALANPLRRLRNIHALQRAEERANAARSEQNAFDSPSLAAMDQSSGS